MDVYPESWMYTAAAEDAIENAVEMGYECVDCPSCDRGGPWLHKTEASVECPLCGAIIERPVSFGMMLLTMIENADDWMRNGEHAALDAAGGQE